MHITPVTQEVPEPQRQPLKPQLSERWRSQAAQAPPLVPHWLMVPGARQVVPEQQPCEQVVESQTHTLLKQRVPAPHCALLPQRQVPLPQLLARVESQL